jgi:hypothetical protein
MFLYRLLDDIPMAKAVYHEDDSAFVVLYVGSFWDDGCTKKEAVSNQAAEKKQVRIGLVSSSSGFGDGAFNDLTLQGVDKAVAGG